MESTDKEAAPPMMSDVANYAETVKTLIGVVLDQTFDIHRRAKEERASLHDSEYYNGEEEFSILGHVELWSDVVAGDNIPHWQPLQP